MASSSLSSTSLPVLASQSWKYDVFLSFRGKDTRKTFVDHLYSALKQKGIYTYKDDVTLERGEAISPTLLKAIEESQIALIIFSKNYANSKRCLIELTHIMKRVEEGKLTVIPIFYDVKPTIVEKQEGEYGAAFKRYKRDSKAEVEFWRKALVEATSISGLEIPLTANGHEAQGIKQIVDEVLKTLVTSRATVDLIGMKARVEGIILKLQIKSGGVRMIGIWGVGGGGKTTLASSIYNEISSMYDGCCIVKNIRDESSKIGLEKLQKKMLSDIFKEDHMEMDKLRHKNVLIVLDDVDEIDQLQELAGSRDWFGQGSRIIITTRDKQLLKAHGVDVIQPMSLFNNDEAIELFCKYAHRDLKPPKDFEKLSKEVVRYAGRLPLALKVLGSYLYGRDSMQWRSALDRLKDNPHKHIIRILKISYDGLEQYEKDLFLDIACFWRWERKDEAMELFDACGFHPGIGVEVLIQKALIVINEYGVFDMHDLVQQMGQYIVREKHPRNPEKHSRVWKKGDVQRVLHMAATTELDNIEAINVRDISYEESQCFLQVAGNMNKLRWIYLCCDEDFDEERYEIVPLPSNFPPPHLCYLKLVHCFLQKQLWEGYKKDLPNLTHVELMDLPNLIKIPDFSRLLKLETFKLENCPCLKEIHPGIGSLESLVLVSITSCPLLRMFQSITRIKKLETLVLRDICLGDEERYDFWELHNLEKLDLSWNSSITRLDFSILRLPRLKWLDVSWCGSLVELSQLPSSIAVVDANQCYSFKSFGDVSNCKWLWNVSLDLLDKLDEENDDTLIHSMLQRNALEDHYINVALYQHRLPNGLIGRLFGGNTFRVHLPNNWYNEFCGFLICIVTKWNPVIKINIKQEGPPFDLSHESDEVVGPIYVPYGMRTCVGYVPFSSLSHTTLLTSSYDTILVTDENDLDDEDYYSSNTITYGGIELIRRKSKSDEVQTTDCSEFWDEKLQDAGKHPFAIQECDSDSSIHISWTPVFLFI